MVNLRPSKRLTGSVSIPPLPSQSITKNFKINGKHSASNEAVSPPKGKRKKVVEATETKAETNNITMNNEKPKQYLSRNEIEKAIKIDYPKLPFDLDQAKKHLKSIDCRFNSMLDCIELKPYQELVDGKVKELDLFRTLTTTIIGQQVSWKAARVINYRFIRLFFTNLPEKLDVENTSRESLPFPHPLDVCNAEDTVLRSAGLSGQKVSYVRDIAERFSDGRLDVREIIKFNEEECIEKLVQIKGVGRWTAEMTLMFALRRGDVLPCGDLGVQKGMVFFFLSNENGPMVAEHKKNKEEIEKIHDSNEKVPVIESHLTESQLEVEKEISNESKDLHETGPHIAIESTKTKATTNSTSSTIPSLPQEISKELLKLRKDGKKAKGNLYLTPTEMNLLSESWKPFRSLGVYMMWALID